MYTSINQTNNHKEQSTNYKPKRLSSLNFNTSHQHKKGKDNY